MDLRAEVEKSNTLLLIVSKEEYHEQLLLLIGALAHVSEKMCYVCVNDPYQFVKGTIDKHGLPADKFFFIDTLTRKVGEPPKVDDCEFVSAPNALTEMSLAISKGLNKHNCNSCFFDTVSSLTIYTDPHSIIQFVHSIITKLKVVMGRAVFIALEDDLDSELVKDLYMFVDKVINTVEKN